MDAAIAAAEIELRVSDERFRLMTENAPVIIWISDQNGKCVHLNQMLRKFRGVAEEHVQQFDRGARLLGALICVLAAGIPIAPR
jgi:PAS domain-containing protein